MRITIDTGYTSTSKPIIKIEGNYTLDELIKFLSKIYPDFTWKDIEITDTLPEHTPGLWRQIKDGWPNTSTPYAPTTGNPITYTGTAVTSGDNILKQYYDAMGKPKK